MPKKRAAQAWDLHHLIRKIWPALRQRPDASAGLIAQAEAGFGCSGRTRNSGARIERDHERHLSALELHLTWRHRSGLAGAVLCAAKGDKPGRFVADRSGD
jgi:hypothetical protein